MTITTPKFLAPTKPIPYAPESSEKDLLIKNMAEELKKLTS